MSCPHSFKSKKYPTFIRKSKALNSFKTIDKIFHRIGLKNHSTKVGEDFPIKGNFTIHFSSSGKKGAWDIATMSMRGISSCMYWYDEYYVDNNGKEYFGNAEYLVGSIIDPYTAIIYITDNTKTQVYDQNDKLKYYGTRMLARCVVRFVVDKNKIPVIFLEPLYVSGWNQQKENMHEFLRSYIKDRIKDKIPVVIGTNDGHIYEVPLTKFTKKINKTKECQSYSDWGLNYKKIKGFTNSKNVRI